MIQRLNRNPRTQTDRRPRWTYRADDSCKERQPELRLRRCPPELLEKYRPIYDGSIAINFRGPKELIDVLKPADVKAFIHIEAEDIGRSMYPKDVEFHALPQGITVDMSESPKVDFKLEPITSQTLDSTP